MEEAEASLATDETETVVEFSSPGTVNTPSAPITEVNYV